MKYIGYWIESLKDDRYYPPQEFVGDLDPLEKKVIIDYLSNGTIYEQYRGYSWCRFGCDAPSSEMGSCDLTDGDWVWPQGLVHYVSKHNVKLPQEFISHAQKECHHSIDVSILPKPSDVFWLKWCKENASGYLKG